MRVSHDHEERVITLRQWKEANKQPMEPERPMDSVPINFGPSEDNWTVITNAMLSPKVSEYRVLRRELKNYENDITMQNC